MAHLGIVLPPWVGHLNPGTTLGCELQRRGHRVTVVSFPDALSRVTKAGLAQVTFGAGEFPLGEWERMTRLLAVRTGLLAGKFTIDWIGRVTKTILAELPEVLRREKFDGVVMDQVLFGVESVVATHGVPMVVACNALPVHFQPDIPPHSETWPWSEGVWARARIWMVHRMLLALGRSFWVPVRDAERAQGRSWRLFRHLNEIPPSLAQVTQLPACLDFPRRHAPDHFHHTGPWHEAGSHGAGEVDDAWLDGRPLIYASIGTLQNGLDHLYQIILDACATLPIQAVLTLGRDNGKVPGRVPANTRVFGYAPQVPWLRRASMVITHAGLNTTLESLAQGLPLVAVPITNDQPGVAARIRHAGVGEWLPLRGLTPSKLRSCVEKVLGTSRYRERAGVCADQMRKVNGLRRAGDIVEEALLERRRVVRGEV